MKITLPSETFRQALKMIKPVIKSNPIVPILENALIEITPEKITVTGSDLQTTIIHSFGYDSRAEGSMALPYSTLISILSQIVTPQVVIDYNEDTQRASIISNKKRFSISGEKPKDFPNIPAIDDHRKEFTISSTDMIEALDKVSFACSPEELRPAMNGVCFDLKNSRLVATDSFRMVEFKLEMNEDIPQFIVPKSVSVANTLFKSHTPLHIAQDGRKIQITGLDTIIHIRMIEERYPEIDNVIPEKGDYFEVDREGLLREVSGAVVVANKTTHQIAVSIAGGKLTIQAEDLDFGNEYQSEIDIDQQGKDLTIGLNCNMLREELAKCESETVRIYYQAENRAILITDEQRNGLDTTILQMPVMLNQKV